MNRPESRVAWLHVVGVAFVYGVLIFIGSAFWTYVDATYFVCVLTVSGLLIFGMWAALGSGVTSERVPVFSLLGPLLCISAIAGFATSQLSPGLFLDGERSWLEEYWFVFMVVFGICIAFQVPFWILRSVLGWQLVQESRDWIDRKISLRDIFFLTAVFAVGFALPSYASSMLYNTMVDQIQIGYLENVETDKVDVNGTPLYYELVEVTEDNIDEMRKKRSEEYGLIAQGLSLGVAASFGTAAVVALLFAPAVWLTLRMSGTAKGIFMAVPYLVAIFLAIMLPYAFWFSGGFIVWGQLIQDLITTGFGFIFASMMPLLLSRSLGIRVASKRDFRERRVSV